MFDLLADVRCPSSVRRGPNSSLISTRASGGPAVSPAGRWIAGQFSSDRSPVLLFTAVSGHSAGATARTWRSRERPMELAASS